MMPDDTSPTSNDERSPVAAGEDYEVKYLAELTGLTPKQARILLRRYGNDREKLLEEAKVMRGD